MKRLCVLTLFVAIATAAAASEKETMCVKQKDGTYKCKASGKIEKEPCCDTPANPTRSSQQKK